MTVSPQQVPAGDGALGGFAEARYAVARQALADAEPLAGYRGIAQLSGHLAVMRRLVCQAAVRRLAPDPSLPAAYLADARQAEWALRLLEMRLAGDGCAARVTIEAALALLEQRLDRCRAAERALLAWLEHHAPPAERARLARAYRVLLAAAPTRPHPRGPRSGWPGRLAFRFHAFWDRVLDTMDSRPGAGRPPP
jgi:hypothetical protein